jgi:hypothetical protein
MLSRRLLLIAFAYFVLGIGLGIYMGAAQDFRFVHVHAHLNLLGWVALALIALAYRAYPELERGALAHAHFWLHNLGLPIFMGGFAWNVVVGEKHAAPLAIGSLAIGVGVLLLALQAALRLRGPLRAVPGAAR